MNRKIPFFLLRCKSSRNQSKWKIRLDLYKSNRNAIRLDLFRLLSDIPLKQAGAELCQAQANLDSSVLIVEFVFIFEVVLQNNSNYCVLVGHAYLLTY